MMTYYGKEIDLLCPDCNRSMETTLRNGGWSVDCQRMNPLECVIEGWEHCEFDYYRWNPELQPTEEDAIKQHVEIREKPV